MMNKGDRIAVQVKAVEATFVDLNGPDSTFQLPGSYLFNNASRISTTGNLQLPSNDPHRRLSLVGHRSKRPRFGPGDLLVLEYVGMDPDGDRVFKIVKEKN